MNVSHVFFGYNNFFLFLVGSYVIFLFTHFAKRVHTILPMIINAQLAFVNYRNRLITYKMGRFLLL